MASRRFAAVTSAFPVAAFVLLTAPGARAEEPSAATPAVASTPSTPSQAAPPAGAVVYAPSPTGYVGPSEIRSYEEGAPIPAGYHPESRTRTGLIVGGAVTFGSMYFITALVAAGNADAHPNGENPAAALWIPAVGPFIQMTNTDTSVAGVFLAIDGITQVAGLTMLVVGLTSPTTVLVRNDLGKVRVRPVPFVTGSSMGAGLAGTF